MPLQIDETEGQNREHETRITELEAIFRNPDIYKQPDRVAGLGKEYRDLKTELARDWQEWERLT